MLALSPTIGVLFQILWSLHQLTQKSTKFLWTQECQNAFQKLKEKFTEAPILAFPHFDAPFILYTDASDYGIGSVLSQKIDGTERVITYMSRQLSKAERRGPTTEKEVLAVVWSVKHFRLYTCLVINSHL